MSTTPIPKTSRHITHRCDELWESLGAPGALNKMTFNSADALDPTDWKVKNGAPLFPKREAAASNSP